MRFDRAFGKIFTYLALYPVFCEHSTDARRGITQNRHAFIISIIYIPLLRERERTKVVLLSLLRLLFARSISCVVVVVNYTQR